GQVAAHKPPPCHGARPGPRLVHATPPLSVSSQQPHHVGPSRRDLAQLKLGFVLEATISGPTGPSSQTPMRADLRHCVNGDHARRDHPAFHLPRRPPRPWRLLWVVKVLRRCWQTSDGPLMEGELLLGHAVPVVVGAAGRQIDRRTAGWRRAVIWPGPSLRWWLGGPEMPVGLAGDVALEDSHDLGLGEALVEASGDLGAGARLGAHAGEHDAPQRMVRLTVPAPVESVSSTAQSTRRARARMASLVA